MIKYKLQNVCLDLHSVSDLPLHESESPSGLTASLQDVFRNNCMLLKNLEYSERKKVFKWLWIAHFKYLIDRLPVNKREKHNIFMHGVYGAGVFGVCGCAYLMSVWWFVLYAFNTFIVDEWNETGHGLKLCTGWNIISFYINSTFWVKTSTT